MNDLDKQKHDLDKRKLLSIVSHGSAFLSSTVLAIGIPIAIFLTTQDDVVKQNSKEALNFCISIYTYGFISAVLIVIVIGFPLLILLGIASLILPIIAIFKVIGNPDKPYKYPFIFRLL